MVINHNEVVSPNPGHVTGGNKRQMSQNSKKHKKRPDDIKRKEEKRTPKPRKRLSRKNTANVRKEKKNLDKKSNSNILQPVFF